MQTISTADRLEHAPTSILASADLSPDRRDAFLAGLLANCESLPPVVGLEIDLPLVLFDGQGSEEASRLIAAVLALRANVEERITPVGSARHA